MQDNTAADSVFVIPVLKPAPYPRATREFDGSREAAAYHSVCRNAGKIESHEDRCKLWTGGKLSQSWLAPQDMQLPNTNPRDKQLAEFYGDNAIRLCYTGTIIENKDLYSAHRTDNGKTNSWVRYY
eukprot:4108677-Amphidinium_carterae.2